MADSYEGPGLPTKLTIPGKVVSVVPSSHPAAADQEGTGQPLLLMGIRLRYQDSGTVDTKEALGVW